MLEVSGIEVKGVVVWKREWQNIIRRIMSNVPIKTIIVDIFINLELTNIFLPLSFLVATGITAGSKLSNKAPIAN